MLRAWSVSISKPKKLVNEDAFIIDGRFLMVADGVGRSRFPDLASEAAVREFAGYFHGREVPPERWELYRFLRNVDQTVRRESRGSSTTATCVFFSVSNEEVRPFTAVSIGDSRLYLIDARGGLLPTMQQLSTDHVVIQGEREFLSFVIGGHEREGDAPNAIFSGALAPGQWLVLCTDGCWRFLESYRGWLLSKLFAIGRLPERTIDTLVNDIVKDAARACQDDATLILIQNK
jgi:serine/threonine protein phosphatase PrpC